MANICGHICGKIRTMAGEKAFQIALRNCSKEASQGGSGGGGGGGGWNMWEFCNKGQIIGTKDYC